MSARHVLGEPQVAAACDRLVERAHGTIVRFIRGSRDGVQPLGVPRRRYYVAGLALWWMPRGEAAGLTPDALEFLAREYTHGGVVGAGDVRALLAVLTTHAQHGWNKARVRGWGQVQSVAARHAKPTCAHHISE